MVGLCRNIPVAAIRINSPTTRSKFILSSLLDQAKSVICAPSEPQVSFGLLISNTGNSYTRASCSTLNEFRQFDWCLLELPTQIRVKLSQKRLQSRRDPRVALSEGRALSFGSLLFSSTNNTSQNQNNSSIYIEARTNSRCSPEAVFRELDHLMAKPSFCSSYWHKIQALRLRCLVFLVKGSAN